MNNKEELNNAIENIAFRDIFNLADIQHLQNIFSDAHGVASIITDTDGNPITEPSNFTNFCQNIIRKTELGCSNCYKSDAIIGRYNPDGAVVQPCLSGGLWDAGASITVGGKHIASWLIGQVRNNELNEQQMLHYAEEIGADKATFKAALEKVPEMSVKQFRKIADLLFVIANELSEKAYKNILLKHKNAILEESEENLSKSEKILRDSQTVAKIGAFNILFNQENLFESKWNGSDELYNIFGADFNHPNSLNSWIETIHPDYRTYVLDYFDKIIKERKNFDLEYKIKRINDGSDIWIYGKGELEYSDNGSPLFMYGFIQDITDKKNDEGTIKKSEERYRSLLLHLETGIVVHAPDTSIVLSNPRASELLGLSNEQMIGKVAIDPDWKFVDIDNKALALDAYPVNRIVNSKKSIAEQILGIQQTANKNIVWVTVCGFPVMNENNEITEIVISFNDNTERIIVQKKLQENYDLLGKLTAQVPGVVYQYRLYPDGSSRFPYSSDGMYEIYEVTPDEVREDATPVFTRIHPDDYDFIVETISESARNLTPYQSEFRVVLPEQGLRWRHCAAKPQRLEDGSILWHGIITDITERKNTETKLQESEVFFKESQRAADIGSYKLDIQSGMWTSSEVLDEIFGINSNYSRSVSGWSDIVLDEDRDMMNIHFIEDVLEKKMPFNKEYRIKRVLDGEVRWVHGLGKLIFDKKMQPLFMQGTIQDITERKKVENALRDSEERFKVLFEEAPDAMFLANTENKKIVDANKAACQLFKKEKNQLIGIYQHELHPQNRITKSKDDFEIHASQTSKSEKYFAIENLIIDSEGNEIPVEILGNTINIGENTLMLGTFRNITERKKVEKELTRNTQLLEESQSIAKLGGWEFDVLTGILYWSAETYRIHDTSPLEFNPTVDAGVSYFLPKSKQIITEALERAINQGIGYDLQLETYTTKGRKIDVKTTCKCTIVNGKTIKLTGIFQDITQQKLFEETLINSQKLLSETEKIGNVGGWEYYYDSGKMNWTEETYNIHELTYDKNVSLDAGINFYTPEAIPIINNAVQQAIEFGVPFDLELDIITVKGNKRSVHTIGKIDSENHRIYGFFQDISERKIAEKALTESEKKLSSLFDGMTEMTVIHELIFDDKNQPVNYRIIDCNAAFTRITGIKPENAIQKLATEVYHTEDPIHLKEYSDVCTSGKNIELRTYFQPMDKHFQISVVSLGNNRFATITNDITEIQKAQNKIIEKNKELENYLYVASHDLRSPLVNIQGFSERLQKQTAQIQQLLNTATIDQFDKPSIEKISSIDIPKSIDYILTNITKMDSLINGLLQLSRTGRVVMSIKKVDMKALFKIIINTLNYQLTELNCKIDILEIDDCYGDENHLSQVFTNLIGNAIKYRDKNRILAIEINSSIQFNRVIYSIKDNGIGINERNTNKIWDVFFRVNASEAEAGEGLGLSLAHKIVEKHTGKIWVESELGIGSTFFVELSKTEFKEIS